MKISEVHLYNFWDHYSIDWKLNSDINIITGSNGSGKTTILDMLAMVLTQGKLLEYYTRKVFKIEIIFDDGTTFTNINVKDSYNKLKSAAEKDYSLKELVDQVNDDLGENSKRINSVIIEASYSSVIKDKKKINPRHFLRDLDIDILSTFDTAMPSETDSSRKNILEKEGVNSELDLELYHLQERYSYYLADLANKVEKSVVDNKNIDANYFYELYKKKNIFIEIVNSFFKETNKRIDTNKAKLTFLVNEAISLKPYDLSSGEKQALYIFLNVLLQDGKDCIIFMDEPEISMHIDWQEILIDKIRLLNPNCQIIMATHAPSVVIRGWDNFITQVEDIKHLK